MVHWKRSRGINQKVLRDRSGKEQITAMFWGVLKLALPLLEPSCLSFAYRSFSAAVVPALLLWQHKHLCGCRNSPHNPRAWIVTRFYSVLITLQEHDGDKSRLGNVHLKASALLLKRKCAAFGDDSLEGQRAAVPLEMCAKTSLYFLADKKIIGPSVAEIEGAGLGRDWVWCSRALCDLCCCSGMLEPMAAHVCLAVVNHIPDW